MGASPRFLAYSASSTSIRGYTELAFGSVGAKRAADLPTPLHREQRPLFSLGDRNCDCTLPA